MCDRCHAASPTSPGTCHASSRSSGANGGQGPSSAGSTGPKGASEPKRGSLSRRGSSQDGSRQPLGEPLEHPPRTPCRLLPVPLPLARRSTSIPHRTSTLRHPIPSASASTLHRSGPYLDSLPLTAPAQSGDAHSSRSCKNGKGDNGRTVVTALSLGRERVLALLVLGHLVGGVLAALLALAV